MLASLGHRAVGRGDHEDRTVHLRGAGDHVLHIVGVSRAVNVSIVTIRSLVFNVGGVDGDTALFFFRSIVDFIIFADFTAELLVQHHGDGGGQSGFAVVDVTNRTNVNVRLGSFEFFLSHFSLLKGLEFSNCFKIY